MVKNIVVAILAVSLATVASAATYEISVTRKGRNVYKVDGKDIIIHTRYCYAYAYSADSLLRSAGYGGELVFLDESEKCDVKGVFGLANVKSGTYEITVSQEDDDWYEVIGLDLYIQTSLCMELAMGTSAVLSIRGNNIGRLIFERGSTCSVEGIYSKRRL
jgi:hypothetical protein